MCAIAPTDNGIPAAAVGAFLGALFAFIIGLLVERRTRKHLEAEVDKEKVRVYSQNISHAEAAIQQNLVLLFKDVRLLGKCSKEIKVGEYLVTLPRPITLSGVTPLMFRNTELINQWLTMTLRVEMTNQLIEDFREYYIRASNEVHIMKLHGENPDVKTALEDRETLSGFAGSVKASTEATIESVLDTLALINVHATMNGNEAKRLKTTKDLNAFEAIKSETKKQRSKLQKKFNSKTMFTDV